MGRKELNQTKLDIVGSFDVGSKRLGYKTVLMPNLVEYELQLLTSKMLKKKTFHAFKLSNAIQPIRRHEIAIMKT